MSGSERIPGPASRWWMAAVFFFAAFVAYTDRLILGVLIDPIRNELGFSDAEVSLLQGAAFAVVYALAGLLLGHLADHTNRRRLLIAGSIVWCAGTIAFALLSSFPGLFAARLIIGAGEAALAPAAVSMLADAFPAQQLGKAVGCFVLGTVIGGPGAIVVGGALLGAFQNGWMHEAWLLSGLTPWRQVLALVGAFGLLVPALLCTVPEPGRVATRAAMPMRHCAASLFMCRRQLAPLYAGMALVAIGDFAVLTWSPSVLARRFAYEPDAIAMTFLLITTVAGVLGTLLGGPLSDRAGSRRGIYGRLGLIIGFGVLAALGVLLIAAPDDRVVLAGIAIWVIASAVIGIGAIAAVQLVVAKEHRGVGMALVSFFNILLGMGLGPTLVALVTDRVYQKDIAVGLSITTVVLPAAIVACSIFWLGRSSVAKPVSP